MVHIIWSCYAFARPRRGVFLVPIFHVFALGNNNDSSQTSFRHLFYLDGIEALIFAEMPYISMWQRHSWCHDTGVSHLRIWAYGVADKPHSLELFPERKRERETIRCCVKADPHVACLYLCTFSECIYLCCGAVRNYNTVSHPHAILPCTCTSEKRSSTAKLPPISLRLKFIHRTRSFRTPSVYLFTVYKLCCMRTGYLCTLGRWLSSAREYDAHQRTRVEFYLLCLILWVQIMFIISRSGVVCRCNSLQSRDWAFIVIWLHSKPPVRCACRPISNFANS